MRFFFLILFFLGAIHVAAQHFGASPSSTKWRHTNTDTVNVIYNDFPDSLAMHIAALATFEQEKFLADIGNKVRKVDIILQNKMNNTNGYVGLGPFRSEFYMTPSINAFDLGAIPWPNMLTLHEMRHVQQYSNFNNGITKVFTKMFGENGQALANAMAIPNWFFEGDAVYAETKLSEQGRGRIPAFYNGYKALFHEGKKYTYMKLRNGSYKDYVPNHYQLGYLFTSYGYEKYGTTFWRNVTQRASAFKPLFYPFQRNIKRYSGVPFKDFIAKSFEFYHAQWKSDLSDVFQFISRSNDRNVVNDQFVYPTKNDSFVYIKNSFRKTPAFYVWSHNKETKIKNKYIGKDEYFSFNDNKIIYSIHQQHARWMYEYSDIAVLDLNTKKQKIITQHQSYFTPDISHDGKKVIVTEMLPDQSNYLVLMDVQGNVKKKIKVQTGHLLTYPKFLNDSLIVAIKRNVKGEMAFQKININDGSKEYIGNFKNVLLGYPVVVADTLYYTRSSGKYDEAMAYVFSARKNYKLATNATGIYQSFVKNNNLLGSIFTADGYRIASFNPRWQEWNTDNDSLSLMYNTMSVENISQLINNTKSNTAKPYKQFRNMVNFHSMQPYVSDPNYSFSFLSEDVLNTFLMDATYTYNRVENFHKGNIGIVYGGWYLQPFFNLSGTYKREMVIYETADSSLHPLKWNELNTTVGVRIPFNFSKRYFYRYLNFQSSFNDNNVFYTLTPDDNIYKNKKIIYFYNSLSYTQQSQKALQEIYPDWVQHFSVTYRNAINRFKASEFTANTALYFPGIMATHSFILSGAYQKTDTLNNYIFSSIFPFSRGYNAIRFAEMYKYGLNYHLPICYPDFGFANLIYLKRVRANIFFDKTIVFNKIKKQYNFASTGVELYFDTNWWNQLPVTFGIRYSRLLNHYKANAANRWEIIMPINLYDN